MHELALCQGIIESVERHRRGRTIGKVTVQVGFLRQVVPESLLFAWNMFTLGSALDGVVLEIDHVPATIVCERCSALTTLDVPIRLCSSCGGSDVRILTGDELIIVSLELAPD